MSDVTQQVPGTQQAGAAPVVAQATAATVAPAKSKNAIQLVEGQIVEFFEQKKQLIANIQAVDGAIQGAQRILMMLKAEAAKAVAEAEKLAKEAAAEAEKVATEVQTEVETVATDVKTEANKVETNVIEFVKKEL
jgi:hypothetical protein